jgi:putative tryptophan/tyrosine transport system substrate-binding protein
MRRLTEKNARDPLGRRPSGQMRRRDLPLIVTAIMMAARCLSAQQKAIPVIGFLGLASPGPFAPVVAMFRQGLREAGYTEGQNVAVEYRWAEENYDRLPALAANLVARQVDVIVTQGSVPPALAAKNSTATIPIVFVTGADPVAAGLVASLARPGANLTGFTLIHAELMQKRFELLLELVPQTRVIALLVKQDNPETGRMIIDTQEAARAKGVQIEILKASNQGEIDSAFASLAQVKAGALVVGADPFFFSAREQLVALAARHAVPAIYDSNGIVYAGGLISYGNTGTDIWRGVGSYVGKILKGAKPADLPVQQPTTFELVVNLKTAKALGLTVPPSVLARADEVIE